MAATPGPGDLGLAHDHGSGHREDGSHHGGWMGTTMLVVMVAMMATVGVVMMTRGTRLSSASVGGPAALALPEAGPARFGPAGG
jgi:hypothetical protein